MNNCKIVDSFSCHLINNDAAQTHHNLGRLKPNCVHCQLWRYSHPAGAKMTDLLDHVKDKPRSDAGDQSRVCRERNNPGCRDQRNIIPWMIHKRKGWGTSVHAHQVKKQPIFQAREKYLVSLVLTTTLQQLLMDQTMDSSRRKSKPPPPYITLQDCNMSVHFVAWPTLSQMFLTVRTEG